MSPLISGQAPAVTHPIPIPSMIPCFFNEPRPFRHVRVRIVRAILGEAQTSGFEVVEITTEGSARPGQVDYKNSLRN